MYKAASGNKYLATGNQAIEPLRDPASRRSGGQIAPMSLYPRQTKGGGGGGGGGMGGGGGGGVILQSPCSSVYLFVCLSVRV